MPRFVATGSFYHQILPKERHDFNRRILKTVCPVVWEGVEAQSSALDPIYPRLLRGHLGPGYYPRPLQGLPQRRRRIRTVAWGLGPRNSVAPRDVSSERAQEIVICFLPAGARILRVHSFSGSRGPRRSAHQNPTAVSDSPGTPPRVLQFC